MAARRKRKTKKDRQRAARRLMLILTAAVVVIVGGLLLYRSLSGPGRAAADFGDSIREFAAIHGAEVAAADEPIRKIDGVFHRSWRLEAPDRDVAAALRADLEKAAGIVGAEVGGDDENPDLLIVKNPIEVFRITVVAQPAKAAPTPTPRPRPTATPRPAPPRDARGRLAIILDDGGQSMNLVPLGKSLRSEVAVSVLPFLPHSAETATEMHKAGHEIWLHLPLEPSGYPQQNPGPGAIFVGMSEAEIRTKTQAALNNVPHVVGVNHHMGSKASADLRVMTWIMQELSVRNVVFVDSRTNKETVAEYAAQMQGVPSGRRHVFLDNERTRAGVKRALADAVYRARMEGEIIAIGHFVPVTVETLLEELRDIESRKVDLIPPSKLAK